MPRARSTVACGSSIAGFPFSARPLSGAVAQAPRARRGPLWITPPRRWRVQGAHSRSQTRSVAPGYLYQRRSLLISPCRLATYNRRPRALDYTWEVLSHAERMRGRGHMLFFAFQFGLRALPPRYACRRVFRPFQRAAKARGHAITAFNHRLLNSSAKRIRRAA